MRVYLIINNKPVEVTFKVKRKKNETRIIIPIENFVLPLPNELEIYMGEDTLPDGYCTFTAEGLVIKYASSEHEIDIPIFITYSSSSAIPKSNILEEANEIVKSRQTVYGDVSGSFGEIAQLANLTFSNEELASGVMNDQKIIKVMRALKIIRDKHSPGNRDHLRDEAGYIRILELIRDKGKP